jgi:outer membrane protein assembly factor BamB
LVWSTDPSLTPAQVFSYLENNAVPLGDAHEYGVGVLNVAAAVKVATDAGYNLPPIIGWPLPWPASLVVGDEMEVYGLLPVLDGDTITASALITSPTAVEHSIPLSLEENNLWVGYFVPTESGAYSFSITVQDGTWTRMSPTERFFTSSPKALSGWGQHGGSAAGGSFVPYNINLASREQIYYSGSDIGAGGSDSVVGMYGRADVPEEVFITRSPPCPFGTVFGERWLFDPELGIFEAYNQPYDESIPISCEEGVGAFPETAASNGTFFTFDQGSLSSSQSSRLQSFDPWGRLFWLTQLEDHAGAPVRLQDDALYVVNSYGGLWKIDARTGRRLWNFQPDPFSAMRSPPAIDVTNDLVFIKVANKKTGIYALNAVDGSVAWHYSAAEPYDGDSGMAILGNKLVFCDGRSSIQVLEFTKDTRQLLWKTSLNHLFWCHSTPAVLGNKYVIAYAYDPGTGSDLNVLSLDTGDILADIHVVDHGHAIGSPIVVGKHFVFLADSDGYIRGYLIIYTDGEPDELIMVWEDAVDLGASSRWDLSGLIGEYEDGGKYLLIPVSSNNGYFEGHKFDISYLYAPFETFLPEVLK